MKVLGKISLAALLLLCAALLIAAGYYFAVTADTKLERGKLVLSDCYAEVFDDAGDKTAEVSFTGSDKKAGPEELPHGELVRVYTKDGGFLGVYEFEEKKNWWKSKKMFPGVTES